MNIFKKWREYRAAKRKKKELRQTSRVFGHIEQLWLCCRVVLKHGETS